MNIMSDIQVSDLTVPEASISVTSQPVEKMTVTADVDFETAKPETEDNLVSMGSSMRVNAKIVDESDSQNVLLTCTVLVRALATASVDVVSKNGLGMSEVLAAASYDHARAYIMGMTSHSPAGTLSIPSIDVQKLVNKSPDAD